MRSAIYLLLIGVTTGYSQQLRVDGDRSSIVFQIRNFGLDVRGTLSGAKGSIVLDSANIDLSSFKLSADASSINSGISLRDQHLQKRDYLDTRNYKTLDFISTSVRRTQLSEEIIVKGKLTIKNISKEIVVPVRVIVSQNAVDFIGSFTINRLDYMVGTSSFTLADQVKVEFLIGTEIP